MKLTLGRSTLGDQVMQACPPAGASSAQCPTATRATTSSTWASTVMDPTSSGRATTPTTPAVHFVDVQPPGSTSSHCQRPCAVRRGVGPSAWTCDVRVRRFRSTGSDLSCGRGPWRCPVGDRSSDPACRRPVRRLGDDRPERRVHPRLFRTPSTAVLAQTPTALQPGCVRRRVVDRGRSHHRVSSCSKVKWAALDLSGPYRRVYEMALPSAAQVADPFRSSCPGRSKPSGSVTAPPDRSQTGETRLCSPTVYVPMGIVGPASSRTPRQRSGCDPTFGLAKTSMALCRGGSCAVSPARTTQRG